MSDCAIARNNCSNNGTAGSDAGIHVTGSRNVLDSNKVTSNHDTGIRVTFTGNVIMRNIATGQIFSYAVTGGNDAAPASTVSASTNPWLNILD